MERIEYQATIPAGPIAEKWLTFVFDDFYNEVGYLGTMNTAKTNAGAHYLNRRALDYPGSKQLLFRGELSTLKRTTLDVLLTEFKDIKVEYEDKQLSIIQWLPYKGRVSRLFCMGLNTGDLKTKLKTHEFLSAFGDEVNECEGHPRPGAKLDLLLTRMRQRVEHRFSYRERIRYLIQEGHVQDYDEGISYFNIDPDDLDEHQIARGSLRYAANDEGNDWVWNRIINPYGNKPHPPKDIDFYRKLYGPGVETVAQGFQRWVAENVTPVEIHIKPDRNPTFSPGSICYVPFYEDGNRYHEVKEVYNGGQVLGLGNGRKVYANQISLVVERLAMYSFATENHSRNLQAESMIFLAEDASVADQYLHGLTDIKMGLLLPEFSLHTHVLPETKIDKGGWYIKVAVDYNVNLPCATFHAINTAGDEVIFADYEGGEGDAPFHASEISKTLFYYTGRQASDSDVFFVADPSMWHSDPAFPNDKSKTVAAIYEKALGKKMLPAVNERMYGITILKNMFAINNRVILGEIKSVPQVWVTDNCSTLIYGSEHNMGLINMSWEIWKSKKKDHLLDCLRYGVSTQIKESQRNRDKPAAKVSPVVYLG